MYQDPSVYIHRLKVKLKYSCVLHSFFLAQSRYPTISWKCPNFFKGGGTLSPILKFLGRTLHMTILISLVRGVYFLLHA